MPNFLHFFKDVVWKKVFEPISERGVLVLENSTFFSIVKTNENREIDRET